MRWISVVAILSSSCAPVAVAAPAAQTTVEVEVSAADAREDARRRGALRCDWFSPQTAIYRVGEPLVDEHAPLTLVRGRSGLDDPPEEGEPLYVRLRETSFNEDDLPDYIGTIGYAYRDGVEPDCNSYGECSSGAYVGCDEGLAELFSPSTYVGLGPVSTFREMDGVRWHDVVTGTRGASVVDEFEQEERGEVMGYSDVLRMGDDRRYRSDDGARSELVAACAEHFEAGRFDEAQVFCGHAVGVVRLIAERAPITFRLGQMAEARGEAEAARALYQEALDDRPDDAAIQARLEALPE